MTTLSINKSPNTLGHQSRSPTAELKIMSNYVKIDRLDLPSIWYKVIRFDQGQMCLIQANSKMSVRRASCFPYDRLHAGHEYLWTSIRMDRDWYLVSSIDVGTGEFAQDHKLVQLAYQQVKIV